MPGGFVCSGSLKGVVDPKAVRTAVAGESRIRKLFSKQQRAFVTEHTSGDVDLDALSVLGPIFVLKLKFSPAGFGRRMVAELWIYPDGSQNPRAVDEMCAGQAFDVAAETRSFLTTRGINLDGDQQTKTKTASSSSPASWWARRSVDRQPPNVIVAASELRDRSHVAGRQRSRCDPMGDDAERDRDRDRVDRGDHVWVGVTQLFDGEQREHDRRQSTWAEPSDECSGRDSLAGADQRDRDRHHAHDRETGDRVQRDAASRAVRTREARIRRRTRTRARATSSPRSVR